MMIDPSSSETFSTRPNPLTLPVVGIGASAGGLESLQRFFDRCPTDTGFAFVVIQHLSPNFKTLMDTLLARRTSMPVAIAQDHTRIRPDHVYLIPPNKEMILSSGQLLLGDKDSDQGVHLPIDRFFTSLASEMRELSCGIILSGTGSDGSRGVRDIKSAGGLVICESEESAKFSGMPASAKATGCVDHELSCEAIPPVVANHFLHRDSEDTGTGASGSLPREIDRVYQMLHDVYRVDFSQYKPKTIMRRLDRRMALMDLSDLGDYIACLEDEQELRALYADMLIGVTRFFRDSEVFDRLEQDIIPKVIRNHAGNEPLRIWVPGCATGEEAYSIAILVRERLRLLRRRIPVKIFATDVHTESLARAGAGCFPREKVADVSSERLRRYFEEREDKFFVTKELREMIVFARHNVIDDAPFTQLDLISCRNLLIYFRAAAQRKALSLFHFALKTRGHLVLGPSESPGPLSRDFEIIDSHSKIYMKRSQKPLPPDVPLPNSVGFQAPSRNHYVPYRPPSGVDPGTLEIYDRLLDRFMPPALLVSDNRELLETFGGAEEFLRVKSRRASRDVVDMLDGEMRTMVAGGLRQVNRTPEPVQFPTVTAKLADGTTRSVRISIERLISKEGRDAALVVFHDSFAPGAAVQERATIELIDGTAVSHSQERNGQPLHLPVPDAVRKYVDSLEDELHFTKENLQTTIEELEASNEELQATNEEIVASNEELQSTNEELNSVNEELHTVNTEYQNTIRDMRELNEDMNQLLASTDIGTLFLDGQLVIRRFTPGISSLFDLVPQDVGRPLTAFAHHLEMPDLFETLESVLHSGQRYECEVMDRSGRTYFLRALPYGIDNEDHGLVVTFTDIQGLIDAKASLRASELRLTQLIDAVPVLMSLINREERYVMVNDAYSRVWEISQDEIVGKRIEDLIGEDAYRIAKPRIDQVLRGEVVSYELTLQNGCDGETCYVVNYVPHVTEQGEVLGFFTAMVDISEAKAVERSLAGAREAAEHANRAKSDFLANMSHEIRSPLTSILGFADVLANQLVDADNRNCIDLIQRNGQHLLDLINDILDLSKIEAGKFEIEERRFSPIELVDDVIESLSFRARQNKLYLRRRLRGGVPQTILSDPTRLRQVLINLVGNSLKFTREGGVIVSLEQQNEKLRIHVSDTGSGIAEQQMQEVFHPFNQHDNSLTREHEGTGLGLAISQRIVAMLGGTLELESELGSGTTFTFDIDIGPLDQVTLVSSHNVPRTSELDDSEDSVHLDACILVVDDRRDIRYLVEHFLSEAGARVRTAKDGAEALQMLSDTSFQETTDLVVMDIQMPGLDGYETARRLRKSGYGKPILALSAGAMKGDREKAISAGCNEYLSKPINGPQLVTSVSQLLRKA